MLSLSGNPPSRSFSYELHQPMRGTECEELPTFSGRLLLVKSNNFLFYTAHPNLHLHNKN